MESRVITISDNIQCKIECELEYGSYKIRGVKNYFAKNTPVNFKVLSAGNLASACVGMAKEKNIKCTAVVPEKISSIKENKIKSLGGQLEKVPFLDLWKMVEDESTLLSREVLHPIHPDLIEGYGEIVSEILHQVKTCENIFLPYGLGGLALGVVRAKKKLGMKFDIYLVEVENYSPFKLASESHENSMQPHLNSFIEAMGAPRVLDFVFNEISSEIKDVVLVTEKEVSDNIREIFKNHELKIEGAAGAALAGARKMNLENSVALLTGQNISSDILEGIVNDSLN